MVLFYLVCFVFALGVLLSLHGKTKILTVLTFLFVMSGAAAGS